MKINKEDSPIYRKFLSNKIIETILTIESNEDKTTRKIVINGRFLSENMIYDEKSEFITIELKFSISPTVNEDVLSEEEDVLGEDEEDLLSEDDEEDVFSEEEDEDEDEDDSISS